MNAHAIENLERITVAIEAIPRFQANSEDLAGAPLLIGWTTVDAGSVCLTGLVSGHPILGSQEILSSPLVFISPDRKWARTASRWYQLQDESTMTQVRFRARLLEAVNLEAVERQRHCLQVAAVQVAGQLNRQDIVDRLTQAEEHIKLMDSKNFDVP